MARGARASDMASDLPEDGRELKRYDTPSQAGNARVKSIPTSTPADRRFAARYLIRTGYAGPDDFEVANMLGVDVQLGELIKEGWQPRHL